MRTIIFAAALILCGTVEASSSCNISSVRLGYTLLKTGDSERRVIQSEPDRVVQLETRDGGAAGIRYDFHLRGQTVQVYVRAGRITRVCRVRD